MLRRTFLLAPAVPLVRSRRGRHPRLFLDAEGFARLKETIKGPHAATWAYVKAQADELSGQQPPRYEDHPPRGANDVQNWQRPVGEAMPYLAMAYRLTGDAKYLAAARTWALASVGYEHWSTGYQQDANLAAGHESFGVGVLYDWLYDSLDSEARDTIRRQLMRRCELMYQAVYNPRYGHLQWLLQNHLWVTITGLGTAALALMGDPGTGIQPFTWVQLVRDKYHNTEFGLWADGTDHEGIPYWTYGTEYMLKWWHLSSELLGDPASSPWWKQTAAYRLYLGLPRNSWAANNTTVDFADGPRCDYYGADHIMHRLAQLYRDPHAQWVAEQLREAHTIYNAASGPPLPTDSWLNLVWYDPSVRPASPADLPTLRHFDDLEIVSARSGWSGDESLVAFKCGPPAGHAAQAKFSTDPCVGHAHPDAGHFIVFGCGEWLIRDDGYTRKITAQHNTLVVDGHGQLGEGGDWLNGKDWFPGPDEDPRVLSAGSTRVLDEIVAQAAPAYPESLGVKSFVRRLYFLKPDVLIVADEIETDRERQLELRFHPEHPAEKRNDGSYRVKGEKAVLRIEPLTPEGLEIKTGEIAISRSEGSARLQRMPEITLGCRATKWCNVVALSWSRVGTEPVRLVLNRKGDTWTVQAGTRKIPLKWQTT